MAKPPNFPVPNMPRMGRRNAVAYPNVETVSSTGAFSPINLLQRSSTDDYENLDPDGILAHELKLEKQHQTQWENRPAADNPPVPTSSINSALNDGWQQIIDSKNEHKNFIEGLGILDRKDASKVQGKLAVLAAKQKARKATGVTDEEPLGAPRVIPWKKMDDGKTTLAEERRKLYASFNMTSFEPPETPNDSQARLKRRQKKNAQSNESIASSTKEQQMKSMYANVQPKVDTGMRKIAEDDSQDWKLPATLVAKMLTKNETASKPAKTNVKNNQGAKKQAKPAAPIHTIPKFTNDSKQSRLVNNYPAAETVKNVTDKLPLTIGPRASVKKTFGKGEFERAELVEEPTTRLFPMSAPHPKIKTDVNAKPPKTSLRNTVMNLQRINIGTNSKVTPNQYNKAPIMTGDILSIGAKPKPAPQLTTIQAPPSPFLMSSVSVPNQLNPIGFSSKKGMSTKDNKVHRKETEIASGIKGLKLPLPAKNNPDNDDVEKPGLKVIPSMGSSANKYNNIYIGLYSGSESDDEGTSNKIKKR